MATESAPTVRIDRVVLTQTQLRTEEIMLYLMADIIDRLLATGLQYTKQEVPNVPQTTL